MLVRLVLSLASKTLPSGYHNYGSELAGKRRAIERAAKLAASALTLRGGEDLPTASDTTVELPRCAFSVKKLLGEGRFARVFLVSVPKSRDYTLSEQATVTFDESFDGMDVDEAPVGPATVSRALKVQMPPSPLEFYLISQIHSRLQPNDRAGLIRAEKQWVFKDEGYLLMDYYINKAPLLMQWILLVNRKLAALTNCLPRSLQ